MPILTRSTGLELVKKLKDKGFLPPNCKRILVDISVDDVVKIYFACYADRDALEMLLEGIDLSEVEKDS